MGNSKLDDIRERLVIYDAPHIDRMPAGIYLEDVGDLLAVVDAAMEMESALSYLPDQILHPAVQEAFDKFKQAVGKLTG